MHQLWRGRSCSLRPLFPTLEPSFSFHLDLEFSDIRLFIYFLVTCVQIVFLLNKYLQLTVWYFEEFQHWQKTVAKQTDVTGPHVLQMADGHNPHVPSSIDDWQKQLYQVQIMWAETFQCKNLTKWARRVLKLNMEDRDGGYMKVVFDIRVHHAHFNYVHVHVSSLREMPCIVWYGTTW